MSLATPGTSCEWNHAVFVLLLASVYCLDLSLDPSGQAWPWLMAGEADPTQGFSGRQNLELPLRCPPPSTYTAILYGQVCMTNLKIILQLVLIITN